MPSSGCSTVKAGTPACENEYRAGYNLLQLSHLVNSALLPRNFLQCLAKNEDMVNAERGDTSHDGFWDDIRAVVHSSDSDFQDGGIDLAMASTAVKIWEWKAYLE